MKKILLAFSLAALMGRNIIVHAEDAIAATNEGNSSLGKEKATSCAGCHGEDGNSLMPTFPKLAQQHANYLVRQLLAFKNGSRNDPVMSGMAMAVNDADMDDIAAYYAEQKISANPEPTLPPDDEDSEGQQANNNKPKETMPELLAKGANIYRNGDLSRDISACIACHGAAGEGNRPAAFPALHAQHADYLMKTLTDFKSGNRANNPDNMMYMIANKMTDDQIKAVSYYISTLK